MIRHLTRHFGLTAMALALIAISLPVVDCWHKTNELLERSMTYGATVNQLAAAIPASTLQAPAKYVQFVPKRRPVQIARAK